LASQQVGKSPLHPTRGNPRFGALFCAKTGVFDEIPWNFLFYLGFAEKITAGITSPR